MKYEVSEIDVFSLGKVAGVLYGAMGVIAWLFVPFFMLIPAGPGEEEALAKSIMLIFTLGAPLFYAVIGFIVGLIAGLVYNLMARTIGGLQLKLSEPTA